MGDGSDSGWSEWIGFKTLPSTFGEGDSLTFAVLGDMDYGPNSDNVVANLIGLVDSGQIDVVVHSGWLLPP